MLFKKIYPGKSFTSLMIISLDRTPLFLTSDNFVRSNEIVRIKWPIYFHQDVLKGQLNYFLSKKLMKFKQT